MQYKCAMCHEYFLKVLELTVISNEYSNDSFLPYSINYFYSHLFLF